MSDEISQRLLDYIRSVGGETCLDETELSHAGLSESQGVAASDTLVAIGDIGREGDESAYHVWII